MSNTDSHAKKRGPKMSAEARKHAQMAANRKAQLQWYVFAGFLVLVVVAAIIIVTVATDGEITVYGN